MIKILAVTVLPLLALPCAAQRYAIDPASSTVKFSIKHMAINRVHGKFEKFAGWFDYAANDLKTWKTSATIEAASINTGIKMRDQHLRNPDFFEVEKYPALEFMSESTEEPGGVKKIKGNLAMHGVALPVALQVEEKGVSGNRAVFDAQAELDRKDFKINGGSSGGLIGKKIRIQLHIEGIAIR